MFLLHNSMMLTFEQWAAFREQQQNQPQNVVQPQAGVPQANVVQPQAGAPQANVVQPQAGAPQPQAKPQAVAPQPQAKAVAPQAVAPQAVAPQPQAKPQAVAPQPQAVSKQKAKAKAKAKKKAKKEHTDIATFTYDGKRAAAMIEAEHKAIRDRMDSKECKRLWEDHFFRQKFNESDWDAYDKTMQQWQSGGQVGPPPMKPSGPPRLGPPTMPNQPAQPPPLGSNWDEYDASMAAWEKGGKQGPPPMKPSGGPPRLTPPPMKSGSPEAQGVPGLYSGRDIVPPSRRGSWKQVSHS